ncbi:4Fe-4S dicluster domain-containing protein [Pseudonocardia xishanensis]|uniref:4Fe-4S ferredoxin-type domain-containing protein n=1 Tax=Pseudonocardia xishanensis TaxID=630995 RepID=A0ABP8RTC2_9PSEU
MSLPLRERASALFYRVIGRISQSRRMRHVPLLPLALRTTTRSPAQPWDFASLKPPPDELRTVPGIRRRQDEAWAAFHEHPLRDFARIYSDAMFFMRSHMWASHLLAAPVLQRARRRIRVENASQPPAVDREPTSAEPTSAEPTPAEPTPAEPRPGATLADEVLAAELRALAAGSGISAIGFADYDPRYVFQEHVHERVGDRVIVCVQEQNWESTQRIPSTRSERTALSTYGELIERAAELVDHLKARGYRAMLHDPAGSAMMIHYGVEAGLGQLGLNGQLLTPFAGSRCRLIGIDTDAPLPVGRPVDFGITGLCDKCRICVRRCPSGAIPQNRRFHRGVEKAKINTKRCLPVVAQAEGCAVCMKVCPVQRYGLPAVMDHFEATGDVLGKGTDELEGYLWPVDGERYGPGSTPRLAPEFLAPPVVVAAGLGNYPVVDEQALAARSTGTRRRGGDEEEFRT